MYDPNIAIAILIGSFLFMVVIRVPIAFSLAISAFASAAYCNIPLMAIAQYLAKGINSFSLLAIPFFILAGEIMGAGGISDRLIKFADVLIGWMRGGLAMVNILASMFFGGISGSAVADTSSIGAMMIPMMEKQGYDKDYSINVTISSACQGVLIPPSHNMIIYAMAAGGVSVGRLFMAGLFPGILLGIALMILSYIIAVKRNYPKGEKYTMKQAIKISMDSILGLMTAVIIMGGVIAGIFTATESAAVACIWAFVVTFFVYRDIKLPAMIPILKKTLRTLAMVMAVIAASSAFGYMMATLRVPALVTESLMAISSNKIVIFLLINALLLVLGCIMDMAPLILIVTPILLPVVTSFGMDPVQFGILLMLTLVSSLGGNPTPMAYAEVYSGLQTGVIEGAENNWPSYMTQSHNEVAKYFVVDGHTRSPEMIIISTIVWESLNEDEQKLIKECALEAATFERAEWLRQEKEYEEQAIATGSVVTYLTDEEYQQFVDAVQPVYELDAYKGFADLVKKIRETA